jgi:integrase/recombinase XerD
MALPTLIEEKDRNWIFKVLCQPPEPELVSGFIVAASNNQLAAHLSQVADSLVKQD